MAYSFRYYWRKPTLDPDHLSWLRYDVQLSRVPTSAEMEALADALVAHLSSPAAIAGPVHWSERFGHFTVGERFHSKGAILGRFTDFLMAAHAIVPIADVVLLNHVGSGSGKWDAWTAKTQATPDPGPDWTSLGALPGRRRPFDPSLPAPSPNAAFDAARSRASSAAQTARVLESECDPGLELVVAGTPALPELPEPLGAHIAAAGATHVAVSCDLQRVFLADGRDLSAMDPATGEVHPRARFEYDVRGLAWLDGAVLVARKDAVRLVDPDTGKPLGEPFTLVNRWCRSLHDDQVVAVGRGDVVAFVARNGPTVSVLGRVHLKETLFLKGSRGPELYLHRDGTVFAVRGADSLHRAHRPTKKVSSAKKAAFDLVPAEPPGPSPWPDASEVAAQPGHGAWLSQIAPGSGASACIGLRKEGYDHLPSSLTYTLDGDRVVLGLEDLGLEGSAILDLTFHPDGDRLMLSTIEHPWQGKRQETSTSFYPKGNSIHPDWQMVEVDLWNAEATPAFAVSLAPKPLSDGRKRGYKDIRLQPRPGGQALALWNKQPYHGVRWLSKDDVLVVHQKGALWFHRGEEGWHERAAAKVAGTVDAVGHVQSGRIAVLGTKKARLTVLVWDAGKGKLKKKASFPDNLKALALDGDRILVQHDEGHWLEVS